MLIKGRCALKFIGFAMVWQVYSLAPTLAMDPEVAAKKQLCHTCLMKIYMAQRKFPEAMVESQALLTLTPNDARLHFDYANLLFQAQKQALAVQQYRAAAKLQPYVPEYQAGLGVACLNTKNYDTAVTALTKACQLGGKFEKELQLAQQYQAQQKQLVQYTKKVEEKRQEEDE